MHEANKQLIHPSDNVEKYTVLALSTGHLTAEDSLLLKELSRSSQMILGRDAGYFFKLYEDEVESNLDEGMSEHLKHIIQCAHNSGFRMIEFDSDANVLPQFATFDW